MRSPGDEMAAEVFDGQIEQLMTAGATCCVHVTYMKVEKVRKKVKCSLV